MSAIKNLYFQEICDGLEQAKQSKQSEFDKLTQKSKELTAKFMDAETDSDIQELNIEVDILKKQFKNAI